MEMEVEVQVDVGVGVSRIPPLDPPYPLEVQKLFDLVMPSGMDPLLLFRTLATNRRIFPRFMRAGVLDRGPVAILDRELVILRTTARCDSEYEWGIHVAAFGRPLGLSHEQIRATVTADAGDPIWSSRQAMLIRLCDELHDVSSISDALWDLLERTFEADARIELIYTIGLYHVVSYLTNGLRLALEPNAERFPTRETTRPRSDSS